VPRIDPPDAADLYESKDGDTIAGWTRIGTQLDRTSRWLDYHYLVLANQDGEHYGLSYGTGLTEMQEDELPWEDSVDRLPLVRLYPHQVTTTVYRTEPADPTGQDATRG
jgi:hypothetical protein